MALPPLSAVRLSPSGPFLRGVVQVGNAPVLGSVPQWDGTQWLAVATPGPSPPVVVPFLDSATVDVPVALVGAASAVRLSVSVRTADAVSAYSVLGAVSPSGAVGESFLSVDASGGTLATVALSLVSLAGVVYLRATGSGPGAPSILTLAVLDDLP